MITPKAPATVPAVTPSSISAPQVALPKSATVAASKPVGAAAMSAAPATVAQAATTPVTATPVTGPQAAPAPAPAAPRPVGVPAPAKPGVGASHDRTGRVKTTGGRVRPARKARLRVAKLDPWSVMKVSLMFSIAMGVIVFVAVALLWSVVEASGALVKLQETLNALLGNPDGSGTVQVTAYVDRWRVLGFTAVVCGINVILLTAIATLWAFLYNLASTVLGGLEITLAEE